MKVGIIHPPIDLYGGAEVVAIATANALAKGGYDVSFFTDKMVDQKRITGLIGEPLDASIKIQISPGFLPPRSIVHVYDCAVRTIGLKLNCDVLVDTYSNCVFPWADVFYIHFPYFNNYQYRVKFPYLKRPRLEQALAIPYGLYARKIERYKNKLLFSNSYFTARVVKESMGIETKVLYPPVPNTIFTGKNNYETRENLAVTIARFDFDKGLDTIPDIARIASKSVHFVIIGLIHNPNALQLVKNKIKKFGLEDRITIITNASKKEAISYLSKAKIYLHTTKMEHFGISIAEAMAKGCLPVVHNSGGAPEFVPDQYRYNNTDEAASIVNSVSQNWSKEKAQQMELIAEQFSEANYCKNFLKFFSDYLNCKS
jgi:glycosyltransferase involved in cell wall biosynthesis